MKIKLKIELDENEAAELVGEIKTFKELITRLAEKLEEAEEEDVKED